MDNTLLNGIIVTVGPTMESESHFKSAIESGALNFRFHLAHRRRNHIDDMQRLRKISEFIGKSICVIFDLPSSRPRTGEMEDRKLQVGEKLYIQNQNESDDPDIIPLPDSSLFFELIEQDNKIVFADGKIVFKILDIADQRITVELVNLFDPNFMLKSNMGLTIPGKTMNYTLFTHQDKCLIKNCFKSQILPDWLALSYVSNPQQVLEFRDILFTDFDKWHPKLMAKIETQSGLENVKEIAKVSDGLMVARGDLLAEIEPESLYDAQEKIIQTGKSMDKIVVTATQMLEIFSETGNYYRPELIDLSCAVSQGTTSLMLSKESCFCMRPNGPGESIQLMRKIIDKYSQYSVFDKLPLALLKPGKRHFKIIAVEGPNGVGKSTLCKNLAKVMKIKSFFGVAEEFLTYTLKKRMIFEADWMASALYFISAAIELNRELSLKHRDKMVLTDRSPWSTASQHIALAHSREDFIFSTLESVANKLPMPDHILILEANYKTCLKRIEKKQEDQKYFDKDTEEYFINEQLFYRRIHSQHPSSIIISTDGLNEEQVLEITIENLKKIMEE